MQHEHRLLSRPRQKLVKSLGQILGGLGAPCQIAGRDVVFPDAGRHPRRNMSKFTPVWGSTTPPLVSKTGRGPRGARPSKLISAEISGKADLRTLAYFRKKIRKMGLGQLWARTLRP